MRFGNDPAPTPPAVGGILGVTAQVYETDVSVVFPTTLSVSFHGVIPETEAVGTTITEECLVLGNGVIFARTLLSEPKTADYSLLFVHTIALGRL
jgi:hypothetical protein